MERPKSSEIFKKLNTLIPGGVSSPVRAFHTVGMDPLVAVRGEGPYLFDADGNRFVDFVMSWGPLVLGHAYPKVISAVQKQAENGTSFGVTTEREAELAELVMEFFPSVERVRFVSSGTEAGMSAIRLARGFTKREKIIKFSGCYHGHVDALLVAAGSGAMTLGIPGSAGVPDSVVAGTLTAEFNDVESVQKIFESNRDEIAAVILEPIMGNCGFIPPEGSFLRDVQELAQANGALFIADEVMTGFRVAPGGAQELYSFCPDLTMLGKVIGGGLPVGAFGGRKDIMEHIAPAGEVYQAGTLSGNPLAMAAGIATLQEWRSREVFNRAAGFASSLVQAFQELSESNGIALQASSLGTMFGFFFSDVPVKNFTDANNTNRETFNRFYRAAIDEGLYFAQSPFEAGFVSAAHTDEVLTEVVRALDKVFQKIS